ncbi:MAG: hypothetical protein RLZZ400_244 [Actinomycetota bacterium]
MSSFNGGYDLSKLKKPATPTSSNPPQAGSSESTAPAADGNLVAVPALVFDVSESNLRELLQLSARIPVIFEFHVDSKSPLEFSDLLKKKISALQGRLVLARVDAQLDPRVATAFSVTGVPTVLAVLRGQPVPLFEGQADEPTLDRVFEQVLLAAQESGISSVAVVDEQVETTTPPLPKWHQAAYDAIGRLDFEAALAAYKSALDENPGDLDAKAGMAQVRLMQRTIDVDPSALPATPGKSLDELFHWADVKTSIGDYESAFQALLDAFAAGENRDQVREHLLELFSVVPQDDAALASARRRLASLLY